MRARRSRSSGYPGTHPGLAPFAGLPRREPARSRARSRRQPKCRPSAPRARPLACGEGNGAERAGNGRRGSGGREQAEGLSAAVGGVDSGNASATTTALAPTQLSPRCWQAAACTISNPGPTCEPPPEALARPRQERGSLDGYSRLAPRVRAYLLDVAPSKICAGRFSPPSQGHIGLPLLPAAARLCDVYPRVYESIDAAREWIRSSPQNAFCCSAAIGTPVAFDRDRTAAMRRASTSAASRAGRPRWGCDRSQLGARRHDDGGAGVHELNSARTIKRSRTSAAAR